MRKIKNLLLLLGGLVASFQTSLVHGQENIFARDTFRMDKVVCPFKGKVDYEPGDIECGLLEVPENREKADSRFIELHFVKINSSWSEVDVKDGDESTEGTTKDSEQTGLAPGKREDPVK